MYVILGASGNTGSVVAETLLKKREKVRVVGRDKERLAPFVEQGAEEFLADASDSLALTKAFQGARAVYAMIPPYEGRVVDPIVRALDAARVTHVVALSSFGADKESKTGPLVGLHQLEARMNGIPGLNALHLRAGYFMENMLPQVGIIKNMGNMAGPVRADLPIPMIATRDVGVAAADALARLQFSGKQTRELLGQRDITYREAAQIIGAAIGNPNLAYTQLPDVQVIPALMQIGLSRNMAEQLHEMVESLNNGHIRALEPRSAGNTTPTSFEHFVRDVFVRAYQGQAAAA